MLYISCALSATSLLSALLSPSASTPQSASRLKSETGLTTYDQKQSGKYNIHLNIKDVAIIALDAGHIDGGVGDSGEDYYEDYDLSDFTVKPIFGLVDITSDKPSSTTAAPPLIHSEPDEDKDDNVDGDEADNHTESVPIIEEPIIKDPINKTQSVTILSENEAMAQSSSEVTGIVVTTPTPASEDLPPKLSLADIANVQSAQKPFQTKPNEIPVQVILEPIPQNKQSSRQRPNSNGSLTYRLRATTSATRRITPPHDDRTPIGNKHRKSSFAHANRRNCVLDQNGQCQNSNRRFGSPTL